MPLTSLAIQNAKPSQKPFKLADGDGLFLIIQPNGSKLWRLRYFYLGKERSLSIGSYPSVTLADARAKRGEAKQQIVAGTDPSVKKKTMIQFHPLQSGPAQDARSFALDRVPRPVT